MSVRVDVQHGKDGTVASMYMSGPVRECRKECAVIPASVLEQYAVALRQQGLSEDEIDTLVKELFLNMMDLIKMHITCIGKLVGGISDES